MCEPCLKRFEYESLADDSGAFRLLALAHGTWESPIDCTLMEDARDGQTFPYEALSYTWGDPGASTSHEIILNDGSFSITKNLYLALQYLRRTDTERILWVDAICINQACALEKTKQVSQMRDIYQAAESVVVWLGEGCFETGRAISWVSSHSGDDEKDLEYLIKTARSIMDGCPDPAIDTEPADSDDETNVVQDRRLQLLQGFADLLDRPWWSRVWVIQEAIVNSDVRLMCGRSEVPWGTFMAFVQGINLSKPILQASLEDKVKFERAVERAISRQQYWKVSPKMTDLLLQHRGLDATDPRDNVFALLGLASDMSTGKFSPDYSKSTDEVYKHLTREIIKRQNDLTIICASQPSSASSLTLPSWTPDWSAPWTHVCLARGPYNAGRTIAPDVTFSKNLSRMRVTGRILVFIEKLSATYVPSGPVLMDWLTRVDNWRTLIADWDTGSKPFTFDNFRHVYTKHITGSEPTYPVNLFVQTPKQAKKSSEKDVMRFQTHMNNMCWNRKLANGRRSRPREETPLQRALDTLVREALVPANAKLGDRVVLLDGCRVPVVLRQNGDEWLFVGDAYLSGHMRGEGYNGFAPTFEDTVFSIR